MKNFLTEILNVCFLHCMYNSAMFVENLNKLTFNKYKFKEVISDNCVTFTIIDNTTNEEQDFFIQFKLSDTNSVININII